MSSTNSPSLRTIYRRLLRRLGPQHWWPACSALEVMVGAIVTQSTNWHNVERAMVNLKQAGALSARGLVRLRSSVLQRLIRPSGYFTQKAARLKTFSRWYVARYGANPRRMFRTEPWTLRRELLGISGIGPETADSILLYAGHQPVFVVDAYTRRIFRRHQLVDGDEPYEVLQRFAMDRLPEDPTVFNELHALLVAVGKSYCHRRAPECDRCPLGDFPHQIEVLDA